MKSDLSKLNMSFKTYVNEINQLFKFSQEYESIFNKLIEYQVSFEVIYNKIHSKNTIVELKKDKELLNKIRALFDINTEVKHYNNSDLINDIINRINEANKLLELIIK